MVVCAVLRCSESPSTALPEKSDPVMVSPSALEAKAP
jgi:hypothetical protein